MPTKSGVVGMCCAAMGIPRGSDQERDCLEMFRGISMTAIAIPRRSPGADNEMLEVRRLRDYHTVQGTRKASGGTKETHLTYRYYLQDAAFGIVLAGERDFLVTVAEAVHDPKWGLWLGRKSCLPSTPVFAGLRDSEQEAIHLLLENRQLVEFTHQREAGSFDEGNDTMPDQPVCFGAQDKERIFAPRRIVTRDAIKG